MTELSIRQTAFVREYLISGNASDAYVKAGYSPKGADAGAARLLVNVSIAAAIAAGRKKIEAKAEADFNLRLDDILRKLAAQVTVDRNELTQYRRGACRYCHGTNHRHQWRTHREYADATEAYMLKGEAYHANHTAPDDEGGYGYLFRRQPHPDCPECEGDGIGRMFMADTTKLSPGAAIVFEGIKQTRDGFQYVMADRSKALETLGKHLGLADKAANAAVGDLTSLIREISSRGSSMPISTAQAQIAADEDDIDPLADYDPQRAMPRPSNPASPPPTRRGGRADQ